MGSCGDGQNREAAAARDKGMLGVALEKVEDREFVRKRREFRLDDKRALPIWLAFVLILSWLFAMSWILAQNEGWKLGDVPSPLSSFKGTPWGLACSPFTSQWSL